jgi:hypothetical protein
MSSNKHTLNIVVARYREDITWLYPVRESCTVYNKGGSDTIPGFHCKILPNFGREGDTYLKHIVENYPNFPDYTIFTQGNIADHVRSISSFIETINRITNGEETPAGYVGLNELRVHQGWGSFSNFMDPTHSGLPIRDVWNLLYDTPPEGNVIRCNYCGIFMVSRDHLLFHSKTFYEVLVDYMKQHEPAAGYVFERLWASIFDGMTKSKYDSNLLKKSFTPSTIQKPVVEVPLIEPPSLPIRPKPQPKQRKIIREYGVPYRGRYTRIIREYEDEKTETD